MQQSKGHPHMKGNKKPAAVVPGSSRLLNSPAKGHSLEDTALTGAVELLHPPELVHRVLQTSDPIVVEEKKTQAGATALKKVLV
ncbi:hypothetical protein INR49_032799 [Caranx melampygus]|nr:hypothetical protein INR49_032799 [Caranx melampygus]